MYVKIKVNEEICNGCKLCILVCPEPNVLRYTKEKKIHVDENRCKGCGICETNCPKSALTIS